MDWRKKMVRKTRRRTLGSHDRWMGEGYAFLLRERLASGAAEVSGADLGWVYLRSPLVVPPAVKVLRDVRVVAIPSTRRRPTFTGLQASISLEAE